MKTRGINCSLLNLQWGITCSDRDWHAQRLSASGSVCSAFPEKKGRSGLGHPARPPLSVLADWNVAITTSKVNKAGRWIHSHESYSRTGLDRTGSGRSGSGRTGDAAAGVRRPPPPSRDALSRWNGKGPRRTTKLPLFAKIDIQKYMLYF